MMIIGPSDYYILYETDQNLDIIPDDATKTIISHLIKEKWVIVLLAIREPRPIIWIIS